MNGWGQISITSSGTALTQDFNTLANSGSANTVLPSGWVFYESGTSGNTTYAASTGSDNGGNTYSYGATSATDRALGGLQSGSVIPSIGASYTNNTGSTITQLDISYVGEQWRLGATSRVDKLIFSYSFDATSLSTGTWTNFTNLDFTGPVTSGALGALNGNASSNRTSVSASIIGLSINSGTTFWVRFSDFNATGADDGLSIDDWSLTAQTAAPVITVTGTFTSFTTTIGSPSLSQSVAVAGSNLTANIEVAALPGFEYSTSDSGPWTSSLSLASTYNGNVYVRLTGTALGPYSGNVSFTSTGATQVDKAVSGVVNPLTPVINVTGSFSNFTTTQGTPSASQSVAVSGSNLTDGISVSAVTDYEYSTTNVAPWTSTLSLPSNFNGSVYVRLTGASIGTPGGTVSFTSSGATQVDKSLSGTVTAPPPTLSVTGTLTAFSTTVGTPSVAQSVSVSGSNLTAGIEVLALSGFEYSTTNAAPWTSTLSLASNYAGSVFIRMTGANSGTYSGNISFTSTGATQIDKAVTGIVSCAAAPLPFAEEFDYPATSLLTSNCWSAHNGAGTNSITVSSNSIAYTGYSSSGIGNSVTLAAASGEDVNRSFAAQNSGAVYASFLINVTTPKTSGDYIFHFGDGPASASIFQGRVFVKKDAASANFAFGISRASTTVISYSGFSYSPGITYLVVLKYKFNTVSTTDDIAYLYINPILNADEPAPLVASTDNTISDMTKADFIGLRQGGSTTAPAVIIDGIRISTNWSDIVGPVPTASTFTGTGNWTDAARWSNGLPGSITNVTVSGNVTVNDLIECNNLTIDPSGSVTVTSGQGLIVNGNMLIQSSASGTGSFIGDAADYTVTGTTTVERFITKYDAAGDDMYHFLSSPVAAQAIAPSFSDPANNSTNDFFKFDEATYYWINHRDNAGTGINTGFGETEFVVGRGYLVAYNADVTKSFTGTLNTGAVSAPAMSYTSSLGANAGWNLLGNPYPSAIDWDNVASGQYSNIDNAVYVYDNASSTYKSYVGGAGSLTDGIIPAMQGFFVHASAASPSLSLENADRVHSGATYYKNGTLENVVRLKVEGNNRYDETFIRFNDEATTGFDASLDAFKLYGGSSVPTFYTLADDRKLSINSLPTSSLEGFVPLAVEAGAANTYSISLVENGLPASTYVTLEDTKTGSLQRLNDQPTYSFTAAPGEDPNRFRLHFKDATSVADPATSVDFTAYALNGQLNVLSSVSGKLSITDMAGKTLSIRNIIKGELNTVSLNGATGLYLVKLSTAQGNFIQKVVVK